MTDKYVSLRRIVLLTLSCAFMGACSNYNSTAERMLTGPVPTKPQIERAEAALSRDVRIGEISHWLRIYFFKQKTVTSPVSMEIISFALYRGQGNQLKPGVQLSMPGGLSRPDDVDAQVLEGEFNLVNGALHVNYYGPNRISNAWQSGDNDRSRNRNIVN